jgi:hypothetical protein
MQRQNDSRYYSVSSAFVISSLMREKPQAGLGVFPFLMVQIAARKAKHGT